MNVNVGKTRQEIVEGYDATGYFDIKEPVQEEETMTNEELVAKHRENLRVLGKARNTRPIDQATIDACVATGKNLEAIAKARKVYLPGISLLEFVPKKNNLTNRR